MPVVPDRIIPFASSFEHGAARPDLIGVSRAEAEQVARDEGLQVRAVEIPLTERRVVWHSDHRGHRLNLVIEDGRVIRAAVF
jgi:hypothetical protein